MLTGESRHTLTNSGVARTAMQALPELANVHRARASNETRSTDAHPFLACSSVQTSCVEALFSFADGSRESRGALASRLVAHDVTRAPVHARRLVAVAHVMRTRVTEELRRTFASVSSDFVEAAASVVARGRRTFVNVRLTIPSCKQPLIFELCISSQCVHLQIGSLRTIPHMLFLTNAK